MNQTAFSTVILRLAGFYILYDLIAGLSVNWLIQQAFAMANGLSGEIFAYFGWLGLAVGVRAILGVVLVLFAGKISRLLFGEGGDTVSVGPIDDMALFRVGLCLLGFYFLIRYLPALAETGLHWFREEAANTGLRAVAHRRTASPIEPLVMTVLSLVVIFRSQTITAWVNRVSK